MIWRMRSLKKLKTLIFSMIKVGCMGFGGGNALIPVIEEEAVKDKKLVSCQEYDRTILAATLTPGALPVELAAGIGYASCQSKYKQDTHKGQALLFLIVTVFEGFQNILGQKAHDHSRDSHRCILDLFQYTGSGLSHQHK